MKISDSFYYPWLGIWFEPRETVDRFISQKRFWLKTILILFVFGIVALYPEIVDGIDVKENVQQYLLFVILFAIIFILIWVLTYALIIYLLGKLFKWQVKYKAIVAAITVALIISMVIVLIITIETIFDWYWPTPVIRIFTVVFNIWFFIVLTITLAHVAKTDIWKMFLINLVISVSFGAVAMKIEHMSQTNLSACNEFNATQYTQEINHAIESNDSKEEIVQVIDTGYRYAILDSEQFKQYNKNIFERFVTDKEIRKELIKRNQQWIQAVNEDNLTEESFDPFLEQLRMMTDIYNAEGNTVWSDVLNIAISMHVTHINNILTNILDSNNTVPLITIYTPDGNTIRDMNHSKRFLVSQIYQEITDFYKDIGMNEMAMSYLQSGKKICPNNPNLYYLMSIIDDNATKNVERYDKVLKLISKSDDRFDYYTSALYNNLGFQILEANMTDRFDEAIRYLQEGYKMDNEMVYSLATISAIYREKGQIVKAYKTLEKEAIKFFEMDPKDYPNEDSHYWIFVRQLVSTSFEVKDYDTTQYVCEQYLKVDSKAKECKDDLSKIKSIENINHTKPIYSIWVAYNQYKTKKFASNESNATDDDYEKTEKFIKDTYIQKNGQADTVQGELLRSLLRLQDEAQRNGNENWDSGYEKLLMFFRTTIESDLKQNTKKLSEFKSCIDKISNPNEPYMEDDVYDKLRRFVVEYYWQHPIPIKKEKDPDLKR